MARRPSRVRELSAIAVPALLATGALAVSACTTERVIIVREPASKVLASNGTIATGGDGSYGPVDETTGDAPLVPASDGPLGFVDREPSVDYRTVTSRVANMTSDYELARRVERRGLSLVNVAWEDTGRYEGSSVGPNITDLTLQVRARDRGGYESSIMPVIRFPNFSDRTGDVPVDKFFVRVGNERGGPLRSVLLADVLRDVKSFASVPDSILGSGNLMAARDSHWLVSAQAVFLPIPKSGKAEFNPVLFNYPSRPGAPAVLSILVTREGTSMRIVENNPEDRSGAGWGQEIYFNAKGQRAAFTAERKSDVEARIQSQGGPKDENDKSALAKGADVLFLVQVPLVHEPPRPRPMPSPSYGVAKSAAKADMGPPPAAGAAYESARRSDVEQAVLGHGPNLGPFREGGGKRLVRDARFPVRITVQFYKATSNGVVSDVDLDGISRSIGSVYEHADAVGSLVLPDGDPRRPTAWQHVPREWFPW
ncbi:MAG: hypothetical protein U0169_23955 [Polyangiaceae bacterium]